MQQLKEELDKYKHMYDDKCSELEEEKKKRNEVGQAAAMASSYSPLTTHILDTALGSPARNVPISVYLRKADQEWGLIAQGSTNNDGRCPSLLTKETFPAGTYRINFDTSAYFRRNQQKGFYPYVDVVFEIEDPHQHYHVPLLLSPYGFSTYRGS